MTKNTSETDIVRHMIRITDGEFWEIVDTGRGSIKKVGVTENVITFGKTEYSSHALTEVVDGENRNE